MSGHPESVTTGISVEKQALFLDYCDDLAGPKIPLGVSANPAGVDITNSLAYLCELFGFGFGTRAVVVLAIVVLIVLARRAGSSSRLPLTALAAQIVAGVMILLLAGLSNGALDRYVG